jgi:hypothetical protein
MKNIYETQLYNQPNVDGQNKKEIKIQCQMMNLKKKISEKNQL